MTRTNAETAQQVLDELALFSADTVLESAVKRRSTSTQRRERTSRRIAPSSSLRSRSDRTSSDARTGLEMPLSRHGLDDAVKDTMFSTLGALVVALWDRPT